MLNMKEEQFFDMVREILGATTARKLFRLMELGFLELEARGILFSLDGPYVSVRGDFPNKASTLAGRIAENGLGQFLPRRIPRVDTHLEATFTPGGSDPE